MLTLLTRQIHLKILQSPVPRHCVLPRTSHDSLRRREVRLARVSMAIVLLYLVCHTPKLVPSLCEILYGDPEVGCSQYASTGHQTVCFVSSHPTSSRSPTC